METNVEHEKRWYDIVEKSSDLDQGDFIDDCEFVVPEYILIDPEKKPSHQLNVLTENHEILIASYDVIIVSQSCDLEQEKIDNVLVCPRWSYIDLGKENEIFKSKNKLEQIRRGNEHRFHMLEKSNSTELPYDIQIVDFNIVFSVPRETMKEMAKVHDKRLRLRSPYKEKLAQAFAYCHMRIGLPLDIQKFDGKLPPQASSLVKITREIKPS